MFTKALMPYGYKGLMYFEYMKTSERETGRQIETVNRQTNQSLMHAA